MQSSLTFEVVATPVRAAITPLSASRLVMYRSLVKALDPSDSGLRIEIPARP